MPVGQPFVGLIHRVHFELPVCDECPWEWCWRRPGPCRVMIQCPLTPSGPRKENACRAVRSAYIKVTSTIHQPSRVTNMKKQIWTPLGRSSGTWEGTSRGPWFPHLTFWGAPLGVQAIGVVGHLHAGKVEKDRPAALAQPHGNNRWHPIR